MTVWKPAKGYETELKVSTRCGVKTMSNEAIATTSTNGDIVFTYNKKQLSAVTLAKDTFGEKYIRIPR